MAATMNKDEVINVLDSQAKQAFDAAGVVDRTLALKPTEGECIPWFQVADAELASKMLKYTGHLLSKIKPPLTEQPRILEELRAETQKVRNALMQFMRDVGDLLCAFNAGDLLWDNKLPRDLMLKVGNSGRACREVLGPHDLWDLTNNPERAASLKRALDPEEHDKESSCATPPNESASL